MEMINTQEQMLKDEAINRKVNLIALIARCVGQRIITVGGGKALVEDIR